ncbi:2S seed storage albumin protein-like [Ricinus communis]|nr:2S seed storage albumin protein-like [Ricinus communis]|eukprot:XP_002515708.2 2S albumin-like [Ricinus communis]
MAKFAILLASFIALLFLVDASIYRTTVIVDEEDANPSYQSCREQVVMRQYLSPCQEYIRQQVAGLGLSHGYNPRLRDCCERIQSMQTQCRCEGLRMAIDQQKSKGQILGQDSRQAYNIAQDLPYTCGVSPQKCRFGTRWGF